MIRANLPTFAVILVLMTAVVWWFVNLVHGSSISNRDSIIRNKDSEIALLTSQRDEYKNKLSGATPDQARAKMDALVKAAPQVSSAGPLRNPAVDWDDKGDVWLTGTYQTSGRELVAYVTVFPASTFDTMGGYPRKVVQPQASAPNAARIEVARVGRFDKDSSARIRVASLTNQSGDWLLQWGEPSQTKSGTSYGSIFGIIVLVDTDQNEHPYSFGIVTRKTDQNFPPPVIIGPNVFLLQAGMMPDAKR
jgi:hypothetical protein